jgi:hypothetical protein
MLLLKSSCNVKILIILKPSKTLYFCVIFCWYCGLGWQLWLFFGSNQVHWPRVCSVRCQVAAIQPCLTTRLYIYLQICTNQAYLYLQINTTQACIYLQIHTTQACIHLQINTTQGLCLSSSTQLLAALCGGRISICLEQFSFSRLPTEGILVQEQPLCGACVWGCRRGPERVRPLIQHFNTLCKIEQHVT